MKVVILLALTVDCIVNAAEGQDTCNKTQSSNNGHALLHVASFTSRATTDAVALMTVEDDCTPGHPFNTESAACGSCHECRGTNKCPCSFFTDHDGKFHFCYDANAPDMDPNSEDGHNIHMHCSTLAPDGVAISACAKNAVQLKQNQVTMVQRKHASKAPELLEHMQQEGSVKSYANWQSCFAHEGSSSENVQFLQIEQSSNHTWDPTTVNDLAQKYDEIFSPSGNRNAASHLWAEYILKRSDQLTHEQIRHMFSGFCPVSGSPLGEPSAQNRWKTTLQTVDGGSATGFTYHCCWPCLCDETDLIKIDTKTIIDKTQTEKEYKFTVIGDPCVNSPTSCTQEGEQGCLPFEAPAVECKDGKLQKAILSDAGHIIIGMYHDASNAEDGEFIDFETEADQEGNTIKGSCEARKNAGYNSGMGAIFQQVARLNMI